MKTCFRFLSETNTLYLVAEQKKREFAGISPPFYFA